MKYLILTLVFIVAYICIWTAVYWGRTEKVSTKQFVIMLSLIIIGGTILINSQDIIEYFVK